METIKNLTIKVAANITYNGFTYNTPLIVEYQHTGVQYHLKNKYTDSVEIADQWKLKGKKVIEKTGYYFIKRLAIPNTNAKSKNDIWYIDNEGDNYKVNKQSKYWNKIHQKLSNNINPFN